jgi:hypothetical protein
MASGRFSKQGAPYLSSTKYLNGNNSTGDSVTGGAITAVPAGINISQFDQNLPGDRFIFSPADAIALSNNNVGNLYTGTYRYVDTRNNSSSVPARGHAAFWDLQAISGANNISSYQGDELYQVTSDEAANIGVALMAGAYINPITAGNAWFIQESGKMSLKFRTALTGTPAIGCGVYLAGAGNNNNAADVGSFDVLVGGNSAAIFTANSTTAYNTIDNMLVRFVGPAETLPSNNNISLVDVTLSRASFRW